jgi:hypothetical protein
MKYEKFIKQAEETIFKDIMKNINILMQQEKTSFLSTGMILKLGVNISAVQDDNTTVTKTLSIEDLDNQFISYINPDNPSTVEFKFVYKDEKHLKHLLRIIEKKPLLFSYHYLRNMHSIILKHGTLAHTQSLARVIGDKQDIHMLVEIANDQVIRQKMRAILNVLAPATKAINELKSLYPAPSSDLSAEDIIKEIAFSAPTLKVTSIKKYLKKVNINGKHYTIPEKVSHGCNPDLGEYGYQTGLGKVDASITSLADQLHNDISSNCKGTGVGDLFAATFDSVKVDTSWFKKLAKSFHRVVYHRTNEHEATWAGLNNTYRHIYSAPKHKHIKKTIKLILSIDNSGSMSYSDLQKLLGLFEKQSKRISEIIVLPHTSAVLKEFTLQADDSIADDPMFRKAIGTRHGNGGTSHLDVFKHIANLKVTNPTEYLYMSFSDNYSDIEDTFYKYPIMGKLTCYWVSPSDGRPVDTTKVPGTNVVIP